MTDLKSAKITFETFDIVVEKLLFLFSDSSSLNQNLSFLFLDRGWFIYFSALNFCSKFIYSKG